MIPVATPGVAALAAALTPRTNYAARSAARDRNIQLGEILTQQEQRKALEAQEAQAQQQQFIAQARSLPFMGRDKQLLAKQIDAENKALFEDLRDNYGGDMRKWKASGAADSWMQGAAQRLQNAPFYQNATLNRQHVLAAQQALQRGERLIGTATPNGYQSSEQDLQAFLSGAANDFRLKGTYKPDTDPVKELREQYPVGRLPWERVQATPEEVVNHLVGKYGEDVARDLYERNFKSVPVFYRTAPITDGIKFGQDNARFGMEQGRYRMQQQDQAMQRTAFRSSENLKTKQGQLLDAKIAESKGQTANGIPFDQEFFNYATSKINLRHEPGVKKQLPHSGIDVSQVRSLSGRTLYGDSDQAVARQLGMQRQKDGTYTRGTITEGFSPENGTGVFDLKNSRFNVLSLEPTLYFDPAQVKPGGLDPNGVNGYAKVRVQFNSDADATAAGLYNERWGWLPDGSTKAGTGVYSPNDSDNEASSRTATLLVPIGKVNAQHNKPLMKQIQKSVMGQKAANEAAVDTPYMDTGF